MTKTLKSLDDLYDLPFFSAEERQFVADLRSKLAESDPIPLVGEGEKALRAWVKRLAGWGVFEELFGATLEQTSLMRVCLAREILAAHSIIADLALVMQFLGGLPLLFSNEPDHQASLAKIRSGEFVSAFAITEPDAGSDLSRLATTAQFEEGAFTVNGVKHLISNVGAADLFVLFARVSGLEAAEGKIAAFLVDANAPGITAEAMPGMIPHPLGKLSFNNMRIPASAMIGQAGKGMSHALRTLGFCRPTVGAAACGMARRAIEEAMAHTQGREAFGGVLADLQLVQAGLSNCLAKLDAARLLVYRAAWVRDGAPEKRHERASSVAKWRATEEAQEIIDTAMQLCGGIATLEGHKLAELYRALRPLRIYEGASEIHQLLVFSALVAEEG